MLIKGFTAEKRIIVGFYSSIDYLILQIPTTTTNLTFGYSLKSLVWWRNSIFLDSSRVLFWPDNCLIYETSAFSAISDTLETLQRQSQELTEDILKMMVSFFCHCQLKMLCYSCANVDKYCHKFTRTAVQQKPNKWNPWIKFK